MRAEPLAPSDADDELYVEPPDSAEDILHERAPQACVPEGQHAERAGGSDVAPCRDRGVIADT